MILQRDERLLKEINKNGCNFITILYWVNFFKNVQWWGSKINDFYKECVGLGYIGADDDFKNVAKNDSFIIDYEGVYRRAGLSVQYLGKMPPGYICKKDEFEHLHWVFGNFGHFTAGNGQGLRTFDPWGEGSIAETGKLAGKRVFRKAWTLR